MTDTEALVRAACSSDPRPAVALLDAGADGSPPAAGGVAAAASLLDAGAHVPERLWDGAPPPAGMIDELLESDAY
jgi:hypothetical protein